MKSDLLIDCLEPFAQLAERAALSPHYKSIEVQADLVRACSAYGVLEAAIDIGIHAKEPVYLDSLTLFNILKSLPKNEEVEFTVEGGALKWSCGDTDGKLAILQTMELPVLKTPAMHKKAWTPTKEFYRALDLGQISCGAVGMQSAGIYGVVIFNDGDLCVMSTDSGTMAFAQALDTDVAGMAAQFTLSPPAVNMVLSVLNGDIKDARISSDEKMMFCTVGHYSMMLRPVPALKHNLKDFFETYRKHTRIASIPQDRVSAFVKRVAVLTENKSNARVLMQAADGALMLSFNEGTSASDEYYAIKGLDLPEALPQVSLPAGPLARALTHIEECVLDYVERGVIIFRNKSGTFCYFVSGEVK